jgi:hypothetical protein
MAHSLMARLERMMALDRGAIIQVGSAPRLPLDSAAKRRSRLAPRKDEMTTANARLTLGAVAGLSGTAVLLAMRAFDRRYRPATIRAPDSIGQHPLGERVGLGVLAGVLYALARRNSRTESRMADGAWIGLSTYGAGSLGRFLRAGCSHPAREQHFPEIAGELLRHFAFGVTTALVYRATAGIR